MCRSSPVNVAARNASASVRASAGPITRDAEAQHVQVVVLDGLPRGVGVVAHRGANAGELARRDRRAGAAAADHDAAVGLPVADGLGHGLGDVGVVHRRGGVGAQVGDLVPALGQVAGQVPFHLESGVIGPNRDAHEAILQVLRPEA